MRTFLKSTVAVIALMAPLAANASGEISFSARGVNGTLTGQGAPSDGNGRQDVSVNVYSNMSTDPSGVTTTSPAGASIVIQENNVAYSCENQGVGVTYDLQFKSSAKTGLPKTVQAIGKGYVSMQDCGTYAFSADTEVTFTIHLVKIGDVWVQVTDTSTTLKSDGTKSTAKSVSKSANATFVGSSIKTSSYGDLTIREGKVGFTSSLSKSNLSDF